MKKIIFFILAAIISSNVMAAKKGASDTIQMDETTISGDKELPQVLYVVPWQAAKDDELYQPVVGFDDGIGFIDQDEFGREATYSQQLQNQQ